jgi:predicted permease
MVEILLKTLPFFAVIGLGYLSGRAGFFSSEATAYLTRFVFYFALSAMLFGFAANLDVAAIFSWPFLFAYLLGTTVIWLLVASVALWRGTSREEAVFEAHTGVIGNVGFLGIPMLALLLGPQAVGPVLLVLAVDLIVFSSLLTMLVTGLRAGRVSVRTFGILGSGLAKNPMIVSVVLGILWGATGQSLPVPVNEFLTLLGAAATPCALFAIGASLAGRNAERVEVAVLCQARAASDGGGCRLLGLWRHGLCGRRDDRRRRPAGRRQCLHSRAALRRCAAACFHRDPCVHGGLGADGDRGDRACQPGG